MNKDQLSNKGEKLQGKIDNKFTAKYILNNFKAVKKFLSTLDVYNHKKAVETTKNAEINITNIKNK